MIIDQHDIEMWKPIAGFGGCYEVSSIGRVRRIKDAKGNSINRIRRTPLSGRYITVALCHQGMTKRFKVHRLEAAAFLGEPLALNYQVNHINGIKTDNRIENLEWVTPSANLQHAYDSGLRSKLFGERCGTAKLTQDYAELIRDLASKGVRRRELAQQFNVSLSTIDKVIRRRHYAA